MNSKDSWFMLLIGFGRGEPGLRINGIFGGLVTALWVLSYTGTQSFMNSF